MCFCAKLFVFSPCYSSLKICMRWESQMFLCQMVFSVQHFENQGVLIAVKELLLCCVSKQALQLLNRRTFVKTCGHVWTGSKKTEEWMGSLGTFWPWGIWWVGAGISVPFLNKRCDMIISWHPPVFAKCPELSWWHLINVSVNHQMFWVPAHDTYEWWWCWKLLIIWCLRLVFFCSWLWTFGIKMYVV